MKKIKMMIANAFKDFLNEINIKHERNRFFFAKIHDCKL